MSNRIYGSKEFDMTIKIGNTVRIYYDSDDDDCVFDEGLITNIEHENVIVDFLDWIEQWPHYRFIFHHIDGTRSPIGRGTVVMDFRIKPAASLLSSADLQYHHIG